jgi:hypothetical protein
VQRSPLASPAVLRLWSDEELEHTEPSAGGGTDSTDTSGSDPGPDNPEPRTILGETPTVPADESVVAEERVDQTTEGEREVSVRDGPGVDVLSFVSIRYVRAAHPESTQNTGKVEPIAKSFSPPSQLV